ncbi:MAG: 16S rRNA (cytosine(1402)-N(4))-methyltransferase, partial [Fimbriimonadales bacterium]
MLREVLEFLPLRPGAVVVDGTLGLGGHSIEMLKRISPNGFLYGFDWDQSMLGMADERLLVWASGPHDRAELRLIHDDFRNIAKHVDRKADAILLDLGLSSVHLDDPLRGISFKGDGPLDMR